jgi:hypothetical protein
LEYSILVEGHIKPNCPKLSRFEGKERGRGAAVELEVVGVVELLFCSAMVDIRGSWLFSFSMV